MVTALLRSRGERAPSRGNWAAEFTAAEVPWETSRGTRLAPPGFFSHLTLTWCAPHGLQAGTRSSRRTPCPSGTRRSRGSRRHQDELGGGGRRHLVQCHLLHPGRGHAAARAIAAPQPDVRREEGRWLDGMRDAAEGGEADNIGGRDGGRKKHTPQNDPPPLRSDPMTSSTSMTSRSSCGSRRKSSYSPSCWITASMISPSSMRSLSSFGSRRKRLPSSVGSGEKSSKYPVYPYPSAYSATDTFFFVSIH